MEEVNSSSVEISFFVKSKINSNVEKLLVGTIRGEVGGSWGLEAWDSWGGGVEV